MTPELHELLALGCATLHEAQGQTGAMEAGVKPLDASMRLVGRAFTVDARPGDNLVLHLAVTRAKPGDVLVVDAKGYVEAGIWGDVLTVAAMEAGVAGLVVDGSVRDAQAICDLGFPVFARALSIKGGLKNQPGTLGGTVTCAGALVRPGDIVVGDRDGVVIVPGERLGHVLEAAREREAKEDRMKQALRAGRTTVDLMDLGPSLKRLQLG